jgi:hypothetical protein
VVRKSGLTKNNMSFDSHRNPQNYGRPAHEYVTPPDVDDPMCVCGDSSSYHVDGCEQCFIIDCGCREFEEEEEK